MADNSLLLVRADAESPREEIQGGNDFFRLEPVPSVPKIRYRQIRYRVRKGDTLEEIADRLNVTPRSIIVTNRLRNSKLRRGHDAYRHSACDSARSGYGAGEFGTHYLPDGPPLPPERHASQGRQAGLEPHGPFPQSIFREIIPREVFRPENGQKKKTLEVYLTDLDC